MIFLGESQATSTLTAAQVRTQADAANVAYDAATGTEVGALNNVSQAQVRTQVDASNATQNNLSPAQANAACDTALTDYAGAKAAALEVVDTELGLVHAETHEVLHALSHASYVFPGNTNLTCTLTALNTANTYSGYVEIADSAATKFSAVFAALSGHITEFSIEELSEVDTIYMIEITYGDTHTILTHVRFAGGTKFTNPEPMQRLLIPEVPLGEKVYYRMKTASAVADTALVNFRYHTHT